MAQKKILVTGGQGFIGSNLIRRLMKNHPDWFIMNLDKLTYAGNPQNLKDIDKSPHYIFVEGDVGIKQDVDSLINIEGPDCVIHMAAESHVDRSICGYSDEFIRTNIVGTYNVLNACMSAGIKKIIYVSTDEVYGSQDSGEFVKEDANLNPSSIYSASKASGDLLAMAFYKTFKLPVVITRSSNNFGPYQYPEKFIPLMITNILEDKKVPIYGDGENVRDWLYVDDNCAAIEMLVDKGVPGEIYNIAANNELTNLEVVDIIRDVLDINEDVIEFVKDRPGHDFRYAMDTSKIKLLGWNPKYKANKLRQAFKETVNWYLDNEKWWREIRSGEYKKYYNKQYNTEAPSQRSMLTNEDNSKFMFKKKSFSDSKKIDETEEEKKVEEEISEEKPEDTDETEEISEEDTEKEETDEDEEDDDVEEEDEEDQEEDDEVEV